jgi:hypothetical protein
MGVLSGAWIEPFIFFMGIQRNYLRYVMPSMFHAL